VTAKPVAWEEYGWENPGTATRSIEAAAAERRAHERDERQVIIRHAPLSKLTGRKNHKM
jgi:hypothetical protein